MRFMGEIYHAADSKGRIVIPARFRVFFTDKLVVTKGFEGCLNIYTLERFEKISENLDRLPPTKRDARKYLRLFIAKSVTCEIDGQNRINLPATLLQEAGIDKQCVFVGAINYLELWSLDRWESWYDQNNESYEDVAESVTDLLI